MDEKICLEIEGMTCNHCASTVDGIIQKEGGKNIHVDYLLGEATFSLQDEARVERILNRLKSAGFASEASPETEELRKISKSRLSVIEKKFLFTLPFSLILVSHMFIPMNWWINNPWIQFALCLPVFGLGLWHFGKSSFESLRIGHITMDILILVGSTSAFVYSLYGTIAFNGTERVHEFLFFETTSTIISLVLLGYVIEHRAVQRTTTVLKALIDARPIRAKRLKQVGLNQEVEGVHPEALAVGDKLLVNAGDKVPADGKLLYGTLHVDESMLTGESDLHIKVRGDNLLSGSIVVDGNGSVEVTHPASESTMGRIIDLVKSSRASRPSVQKLADRVSEWFVPTIITIALITFLINSLLGVAFGESLLRAIAVLVISCPCAMGLATPTAVSVGLGIAGRWGIIVKRAEVFEQMLELKTMVFDKTGTLTEKDLEVQVEILDTDLQDIIPGLICGMEQHSNHPISAALLKHFKEVTTIEPDHVMEVKGKGMEASYDQATWKLGSAVFTGHKKFEGDLFFIRDGVLVATIFIGASIQKEAAATVRRMVSSGIETHILSGDSQRKTEAVARELKISNFASEQLPAQKLAYIKTLRTKGPVGMTGDGINDAPSLSAANIGISLGNSNALAAESSDVAILSGNIGRLTFLHRISKAVVRTIRQNLFWAFAYNLIAIPLAALGYLDPMIAALSMAFSDVVVIGNSLRLRLQLPNELR